MFKSLKFKKCTALMMTLFMVFSFITPLKAFAVESDSVTIQVIATSDTHGTFYPYDYASLKERNTGSLAQLATLVKGLRQNNPNTILVDAGDTIQGNAAYMFFEEKTHPMMLAMNEMGYDTWTLGNHEFNYGMGILDKIIAQSKAKVLSGNVYRSIDNSKVGAPYTIIEKGGVKIGIIGMTPPHITSWDGSKIGENIKTTSPIVEAKKAVEELKGKVDAMVAVFHVGEIGEFNDEDDSAEEVLAAIPEITAFVGAHAHSATNKLVKGVQFVENKSEAQSLQKIDIKFTKKDGKYVVVDKVNDVKTEIKLAKDVIPDADLMAKLKPYNETALKLDSVIAQVKGGDLVPTTQIQGIIQSQIQDTPLVDLINEVQMYYAKTNYSAAAVLDTKANVKAGDFKKAYLDLIYKFDSNLLATAKLTGAQLKKYMEWSASYYNTYKPQDVTISFDSNVRSYNYDMFAGLKYNIDISKPAGSRIVNLTKNDGSSIKDDETVVIAINDYRAFNSLSTTVLKGEKLELKLVNDQPIKNLIEKYIVDVKGGVIEPKCDNNWKIVGTDFNAKSQAKVAELVTAGKLVVPPSVDGKSFNAISITENDVKKATSKKIDIISFNDLHGALIEEPKGKNPGVAKLATVIANAKKENPNSVLVAGGDLYQGSAISNLLYGKPVSQFLKTINLDASAVGNHEFDWGVDRIENWGKEGNFDFLASNIYEKATGKPVSWAKPYKVVVRDGIKIGIVGLSTLESITKTKPENVKKLDFKNPVEAATTWVNYLKSGNAPEGKADVVIIISHIGTMQDAKTGAVTIADEFAPNVADLAKIVGVDGIVTAHSHQTVAGKVNGVPVVQAYYNGRALGRISLFVDENGKVFASEVKVDEYYKTKDKITADPVVEEMVKKYQKDLGPKLDEVIGTTDKDLEHDTFKEPSILGEWVAATMAKIAGTQIGITNGGGIRTSIPKGDITIGKMYELMPFDNTLVKMELLGADIKKALETGVGKNSIGWVAASGLKAYYDVNEPAGNRVTSIRLLDGTLLDMDKYYTVVINDFMATGGDGYNFKGAKNIVDTGTPIREALITELRAVKTLSVVKANYLEAGKDPSGVASVSELVKKQMVSSLPKTGSIVDTRVMVDFGVAIFAIGAVFVYASSRKKKEEV